MVTPADILMLLYWPAVLAFTLGLFIGVFRRRMRGASGVRRGAVAVVVLVGVAAAVKWGGAAAVAAAVRGVVPRVTVSEVAWRAGGLMLVVGSLAYVAWAIVGDPRQGRRRCPRFWGDMSGVEGLTCPGCGRTARSEWVLGRTYRVRQFAPVAPLVLMVGIVVWWQPHLNSREPFKDVPDWVLLLWHPGIGEYDVLTLELGMRSDAYGGLASLQATPVSSWWRERYDRGCERLLERRGPMQLWTGMRLAKYRSDGGEGVVPRVVELTSHADPVVRKVAVEVLKRYSGAEDMRLRAAAAALEDPDELVRLEAAWTIQGLAQQVGDGTVESPRALMRVSREDACASVRSRAIDALGSCRITPEVIETWRGALSDPEPSVRWRALHQLVAHDPGSAETRAAAEGALDDEYRWIRDAGLQFLAVHGPYTPENVERLMREIQSYQVDYDRNPWVLSWVIHSEVGESDRLAILERVVADERLTDLVIDVLRRAGPAGRPLLPVVQRELEAARAEGAASWAGYLRRIIRSIEEGVPVEPYH